jgi:hypothetical protein
MANKIPIEYGKANQSAARIILEHPEQYGPGMCAWARKALNMPANMPLAAPPCNPPGAPDGVVSPEFEHADISDGSVSGHGVPGVESAVLTGGSIGYVSAPPCNPPGAPDGVVSPEFEHADISDGSVEPATFGALDTHISDCSISAATINEPIMPREHINGH